MPHHRKSELLSRVVAVLDEVITEFGDLDDWKWACIGIRRHMAESAEFNPDAVSCRALAIALTRSERSVEPLARGEHSA